MRNDLRRCDVPCAVCFCGVSQVSVVSHKMFDFNHLTCCAVSDRTGVDKVRALLCARSLLVRSERRCWTSCWSGQKFSPSKIQSHLSVRLLPKHGVVSAAPISEVTFLGASLGSRFFSTSRPTVLVERLVLDVVVCIKSCSVVPLMVACRRCHDRL